MFIYVSTALYEYLLQCITRSFIRRLASKLNYYLIGIIKICKVTPLSEYILKAAIIYRLSESFELVYSFAG